jgi:hypothetical protein
MSGLYGRVGLALAALLLGAFAVVSPWLAHPYDDWWTLYFSRFIFRAEYFQYELLNRQYQLLNTALAYGLLPERFQSVYYLHVVSLWALGLGSFHLARRLFPGYSGLAFLYSALLLLWIPYNDQYVMSWLGFYSWSMLLGLASAIVLTEAWDQKGTRRWLLGLLAAGVGYMAIRSYETFILLLAFFPIRLALLKRPLWRADWALLGLYAAFWSLGLLRLVTALLSSSAESYQEAQNDLASLDPIVLAGRWAHYHALAFDPRSLLALQPAYSLPALLLAGIVWGGLRWVGHRAEWRWPTSRALLGLALLGLGLSSLSAAPYLYIGWDSHYRAQMFAMWGQALLVLCAFMWLSQRLGRLFQRNPAQIVGLLMALYVFLAAHWFANAQQRLEAQFPFDQKNALWQQVLALAPAIEDQTLLLFMPSCSHGENPTFNAAVRTHEDTPIMRYVAGAGYLYVAQNPQNGLDGTAIQSAQIIGQPFDADGLIYKGAWIWGGVETRRYGYADMLVWDCAGERLTLLESFPAGYAPPDANIEAYNPYARLQPAFIPEDRWRVVPR